MNSHDIVSIRPIKGNGPKVYIETYGCQMNFNDSEVVLSILQSEGYIYTTKVEEAELILINTCSIRDNAEQRIWGRLRDLKRYTTGRNRALIGIIGCMAERLKEKLIEGEYGVDLVIGPDAYRSLPQLINSVKSDGSGVNVQLSTEETYAEISPVRLDSNGVSAFISIMRGCNNMCAYCVVPYTRGRERSRDPHTILREARELIDAGYREITLLGQNVNSYNWPHEGDIHDFAELIDAVANIDEKIRVRFSTSQRIDAIRQYIPDCAISTDLIAGFCTESEEDHQQTLSLMREVGYDSAFMFKYSERPGTKAQRTMTDDVPEDVKTRRLTEIINLQNTLSLEKHRQDVGLRFEILVEGTSKRSEEQMFGRTRGECKIGDYITVEIYDCTSATLFGRQVDKNL